MPTLIAGSEFRVHEYTSNYQYGSFVTALSSGGFVITWFSEDGERGDPDEAIKARIFDAEGQEVVGEFLVNEYTNDIQEGGSVTALSAAASS